jgi:Flp pilus assembly protein TadD
MLDPLQTARNLRDQDKDAEALPLLEKAAMKYPQFAEVWTLLSLSQNRMRHDDDALRSAERALALEPRNTFYILALTASEQYQEAMRLAKQAIKENPKDFRPWTAKGAIHSQQGDMSSSAVAWSRASALNPKNQSLKEEAQAVRKESLKRSLGIFGKLIPD